MRRSLFWLTFVAAALTAGGASAQASPDDALYAQGAALRAQHRDGEALALYESLHARTQAPRALAQVALAEGAVGRWVDAEAHLVAALAAAGDPWVARNRAALEASLATMRAHVGSLVVACEAPGAAVWVDGRRVGDVGAPLRVLAGTVNFEVRAEGMAPVARVATVPAGGVAREEVRLATAARSAANVDAGAPEPARLAVAPPRGERPPAPSGLRRTLGWAGVGTGAALLVGGAVLWAVGRAAAGDYNDDPACPGVGAPSQPGECASRMSTAQTLEPIAWTGMALGLGLGAAGAVLLATGGGRAAAALRTCAVGSTGVSCRVSF